MKYYTLFLFIIFSSCNSTLSDNKSYSDTLAGKNIVADLAPPPIIILSNEQKDSIRLIKYKKLLDRNLFDKGRIATANSYPGGKEEARYEIKVDDSKLIFRLNSNFTCNVTFQPDLHREVVKKSIGWSFADDNSIKLDKDVFAAVLVENRAYPLSRENFYEYILLKKDIQIINDELRLDIRNTNRENFFVQYLIAEQSGETNSKTAYALKLLNELNYDYKLVWRYIYIY
jgi:hypothetical protein